MSAELEYIINDICSHEPARVKAALQAVAPHREALAPVLCARLAQACAEPERWTGGEGQPSPTFLLYVAAAWKLTEAHPFVVALLRLPPKQCDDVLGDFITEGARLVLADTWPGDLRAIESLAFDEHAEPFARGAALHSAALLVARRKLPRETALALLARGAALPLDPARENDATFADQIVSTALDLRAWELRGTISSLFERELTDPWFCGDLDEVLDELPEGAIFDPDSYRFPPPVEDAWEEVKDWCWFDDLHPEAAKARDRRREAELAQLEREEPAIFAEPQTIRRTGPKIGRNDPCPCGSGKKYKKCCGA